MHAAFVDRNAVAQVRSGSFLLQCSSHHLNPPSFPTRRSSDLHALADAISALNGMDVPASPRSSYNIGTDVVTGSRTRSEEHTSELQSRGHLVCRLLLEKKKKQHIGISSTS